MKQVDIPPYRAMNFTAEKGHYMIHEIVDSMRKRGQLEGIELEIDDGYQTEHRAMNRDEFVLANITVGF